MGVRVSVAVTLGVEVRDGVLVREGVNITSSLKVVVALGVNVWVDIGKKGNKVAVGVRLGVPVDGAVGSSATVVLVAWYPWVGAGLGTSTTGEGSVGSTHRTPGWVISSIVLSCHSGISRKIAVLIGATTTRSQGA